MASHPTYLARRESEGKTRREAIRALKRFLVRAIWRLWWECVSGNGDTTATRPCSFSAASRSGVTRRQAAASATSTLIGPATGRWSTSRQPAWASHAPASPAL